MGHFIWYELARLWDFLKTNEWLALWAEAIALVLIFMREKKEAKERGEETAEQLRLLNHQIGIARDQVRASQNSERAWILATLSFWPQGQLNLVHSTSGGNAGDPPIETTELTLKLTCTNEGRSPAFITKISGYSETLEGVHEMAPVGSRPFKDFPSVGPIGPGKELLRSLQLTSEGHAKHLKNVLSVYVVIEYTDIFGNNRETTLGYTVDPGGAVYRQDTMPDRNRMT